MKSFKPLTVVGRLAAALWRCRPRPVQEMPVERPPRSRAPRGRTLFVWSNNHLHPYAMMIDETPRDEYWTR